MRLNSNVQLHLMTIRRHGRKQRETRMTATKEWNKCNHLIELICSTTLASPVYNIGIMQILHLRPRSRKGATRLRDLIPLRQLLTENRAVITTI